MDSRAMETYRGHQIDLAPAPALRTFWFVYNEAFSWVGRGQCDSGPEARAEAKQHIDRLVDAQEANLTRRVPVQRATIRDRDGTITWQEHCEVWEAYNRAHPGNQQDAECIARRHGFGKAEAEALLGRALQTWEAR